PDQNAAPCRARGARVRGRGRGHRNPSPSDGAVRAMKRLVPALAAVLLAAGCGSSSNPSVTIGAARTYHLETFQPSRPVRPGVPTVVSFTIQQPDGKSLTQYKRGPGPHTGAHLIMVRIDLATIIHRHPPIPPSGRT